MDKKGNLQLLLERNHGFVKELLDDITEEESLYKANECINHIRWQAGHLLYNAGLVLKFLGSGNHYPEAWEPMFCRGSILMDDTSLYPAMSDIRAKLYSAFDRQLEVLEEKTIEELDGEQDYFPFLNTRIDGVFFFCTHELYHLGQIMTVRRLIGRERASG